MLTTLAIILFYHLNSVCNITRQYLRPKKINAYRQRIQKTREEVETAMEHILQKLHIGTTYWNNTLEQYKPIYKKEVAEEIKEITKNPLTKKIKTAVRYIANHPNIKQTLGITEVKENNNTIKIYLKSEPLIQIISTETILTSTFDRTIILHTAESELTSLDILISNITHELGHIHYRHCFFREFIHKLYKRYSKSTRYSKKNFVKDFENLMKTQEKEADFFSIFDDVIEGKKAMLSFLKDCDILDIYPAIANSITQEISASLRYASDDATQDDRPLQQVQNEEETEEYDEHPTCEERYAYMKQITDAMETELLQQKKLNIMQIIKLAELALETEEYIKAHYYMSNLKNTPSHLINKVKAIHMYANAHINLANKRYKEAHNLFSELAHQKTNQIADPKIKSKSSFMLGLFDLNSVNNRNQGIQLMLTAKKQNNCLQTKIKAHKILELIQEQNNTQNFRSNFQAPEPSPSLSLSLPLYNTLSLCQLMDLKKLVQL